MIVYLGCIIMFSSSGGGGGGGSGIRLVQRHALHDFVHGHCMRLF